MKGLFAAAAALTAALAVASVAPAGNGTPIDANSANPLTLAVFGDLPYSQPQIDNFSNLADSVNGDPKVDLAFHLGDIKSGSTLCTDARFQFVRDAFDEFKDPLVYSPGDNEWTDCHRANNGFYLPTERLAKIRELFFPTPGTTLGGRKKQVLTQASDPAYPLLVENTMWMQSQVVFAAVDAPGSNNDLVPWGAPWNTPTYQLIQAAEVANRTAGDVAWIEKAFDEADVNDAAGVVIGLQADMWDPATPITQFGGFTPIVRALATRAAAFGKPVLLFAGDSHLLKTDHPFTNAGPDAFTPFNTLYGTTTPVPNLTRVVVQGSTSTPSSWVRLTVDPHAAELFELESVQVPF